MIKNITVGCPQGSSKSPLLWNMEYDLVLNIQFTHDTKAMVIADDLLIMIRADSIREAESIANVEIDKIAALAQNNKIKCNE